MMNKKDKIVYAFYEMANKQGFRRATMDELAVQAGVSKRTIYRYFESKEAVVEAVIELFLNRIGTEMDEVLSADSGPEQTLERMLSVFGNTGKFINPVIMEDLIAHYPHFWEKIANYRMKRVHLLIDILLRENKHEQMHKYDPSIVTALVISAVQTILNPEFILKNSLTFEKAFEQLAEILKYGLLNKSCSEV